MFAEIAYRLSDILKSLILALIDKHQTQKRQDQRTFYVNRFDKSLFNGRMLKMYYNIKRRAAIMKREIARLNVRTVRNERRCSKATRVISRAEGFEIGLSAPSARNPIKYRRYPHGGVHGRQEARAS